MFAFRSIDAQRVKPVSFWEESVPQGAFFWEGEGHKVICIKMPYDPGDLRHSWHRLQIADDSGRPGWKWDGNVDQPTLSPSILCGSYPDVEWHGYMKAGRLEPCE